MNAPDVQFPASRVMPRGSNAPIIKNATGLNWKPRKDGCWEARWQARHDLIKRGYLPKSQRLWAGSELTPEDRTYIAKECRRLQGQMLVWGRGGLAGVENKDDPSIRDYLASLSERRRPGEPVNYFKKNGEIYFVTDGESVKIGFSFAAMSRLEEIQRCCPVPLRIALILKGSIWRERKIHKQFAHLRKHGEWFTGAPELMAFIKEHAELSPWNCLPKSSAVTCEGAA